MPISSFSVRRILVLVSIVFLTFTILGCSSNKNSQEKPENGTAESQTPEGENSTKPTTSSSRAERMEQEKNPRVKIETSLGDIIVKLNGEKAFLTVSNFLRYANEGLYDGTIFHEVTPEYTIVGGGYTEDLASKPTFVAVRNEANNGLKNERGTIAMARQPETIDSATNIFFINLAANSHLDHGDQTPEKYGYCVFGKVVEGMDVADRIGQLEVHQAAAQDGSELSRLPKKPVVIKSVRVLQ